MKDRTKATLSAANAVERAVSAVVETLEQRLLFATVPLSGSVFGTNPALSTQYELRNAFDGNLGTAFNYGLPSGGYVGIDLGVGNAEAVSKLRYTPIAGFEAKMVGGKFQGSNTGPNSGFVDLHTIASTPPRTWTEVTLNSTTSYRWLRYVGPDNSYTRVSEIEFSTDNSPSAPAASTGLTAGLTSVGDVVLGWTDNASNETGYRLERRTGEFGAWNEISTLAAGTTVKIDPTVAVDRQYYYRVRATNAAGDWSYSNVVPINTSQNSTKITGTSFGVGPGNPASNNYTNAFDGNVGTAYNNVNANGGYAGIDAGTAARVSKIRFFPWNGFESRMNGGKFQGSNTSPTSGFTDLVTIDAVPARGWNEVYVDDETPYRYLRYVGPAGSYSSVAEVEFYTDTFTSSTAGVDLIVDGLAEADEETVGKYARLNDNFDEGNRDANGGPMRDNEPDDVAGERVAAGDDELQSVLLSFNGTGRWKLAIPQFLTVWQEAAGGALVRVADGQESAVLTGPQVIHLWVEGREVSNAIRDAQLRATFTPVTGTAITDAVNFTVTGVDIDVDSDNDNQFGRPEHDRVEDLLEEDATKPGKKLYLNDNDSDGDGVTDYVDGFNADGNVGNADDVVAGEQFVPLPLIVQRPIDLSVARFRISYNASNPAAVVGGVPAAGTLRLWAKEGAQSRIKTGVASGGDYVAPGEYTAAQLGIGANRQTTFWIEAIGATSSLSDRQVTIEVDPDGAGLAGFMASDGVLVTSEHVDSLPGTITGFKWNDLNNDGQRNGDLLLTPPNTVFVIDVSGSTLDPFVGQSVGDVNGDGKSDTVLDGELQAFKNLNQYISSQGYPNAKVSVIVFGNSATILDLSAAPGPQTAVAPGAVVDGILAGIQVGHQGVGQSTNYEAGLKQAISAARRLLEGGQRTNVFFLSDGYPTTPSANSQHYQDEVRTLTGIEFRANVRAFGAGTNSSLTHLRQIDPRAAVFETSDPLLSAFSGSVGSSINYTEPGIGGWTITAFADANGNQQLDPGEASWSTVTEEDGTYAITGLPAGTYVVQEEQRTGWTQTSPAGSSVAVVTVGDDGVVTANFGNHLSAKVNLVIDSNNDNGFNPPDNSPAEEQLEDLQGKRVYVNNADSDQDGLPGYADFDSAGTYFTPLVIDLAEFADVDLTNGTVRFDYSGSDPAALVGTTPAAGFMRLWRKPGSDLRTVGDYLTPGAAYSLASLGITPSNLSTTVWVEGVAPTQVLFDGGIRATLDVDGAGGTDLRLFDDVHVSVAQVTGGTGTIEGHFFRDRNRNRQWDHQMISGDAPDIIMLLDNSNSTVKVGMPGAGIGDVNGDGLQAYTDGYGYAGSTITYTTVLDAEIAAYISLNQSLIDLGLGSTATISLVTFGFTTQQVDLRPDLPGTQISTTPAADFDGNGVPDVVDALKAVRDTPEQDTRPQPGLRAALDTLAGWGTTTENANIFFLSDGYYNPGPSLGEVAEINAKGINFRGFAVGPISSAENLRALDPQASRLLTADDILVALAGLGGGNADEEGLGGWTVYADVNQDGSLDPGDLVAVTQSDGSYTITNVPARQITVRMVNQAGWLQTSPRIVPDNSSDESLARYHYELSLTNGQTLSKLNFGVIEELDAPDAEGIVFEPEEEVGEGSPLRITVSNPIGFTDDGLYPLLYSYDLNNDGDFIDAGESYRSISPSTSMTIGDGQSQVDVGTVRVRIHDALGKHTDIVSETAVDVANLAPSVLLRNVPTELDLANLADGGPKLLAVILDASAADSAAGFAGVWTVKKGATVVETVEVTVPGGVGQSVFTFVPSAGPGDYTVTFAATDKDGGTGTVTRTVHVISTAPVISAVDAGSTTVTDASVTLSATADDDKGEANLRYFWEVDRPDDVDPASFATNGTNAAKEIEAVFIASGTFTFTVYALDDDQQFDAETITVTVVAEPKSVRITTSYATVEANDTFPFALEVVDQFGDVVTTYSGAPVWSVVNASPAGSIDPDTGEYTAGGSAGVDEVSVTLNGMTATAHVVVSQGVTYPIYGAATTYSIAEGQSIGSTTAGTGQGIAGFVDSLAGTTTSDYSVTVDWDLDDTSSGPVAATLAPMTIGQGIAAFEVLGSHQYVTPGNYTFRVTVTPDDGRDPVTIDGTVDVVQAVPFGTFVRFNPRQGVEYDGLVFAFDSKNPADDAGDFEAEITWDPGVTTSSAVSNSGVYVERITSGPLTGYFGVFGRHTYSTVGTRSVSVKLWKGGTALYPSGQEPSQPVTVYAVDAPAPETTGSWVQSSSQLGIQWTRVPNTIDAGGNQYELLGYVIWAYNETTGVMRRLPSEPNSYATGRPTDRDPVNELYYVDQNLPANTSFVYTVQAAYAGPSGDIVYSAESAPVVARTASINTVPAAGNASGFHGSFDDPATSGDQLVKGSQLSWSGPSAPTGESGASATVGYRVYRKELNAQSIWVWRDLFSQSGLTTPYDNPDFRSTLTQGVDWDQTGGQNLLLRILDPQDAEGGRLNWFDPYEFASGVTSVEYAVVGFSPTNDPVLANAIAVSAPTTVTIEKDVTGPSVVTGLAGASYPQAIQLTWNDRPLADDADFGGWNVYRWTGTGSPSTDPNDPNWAKLNTSLVVDETGYNDYTAAVGETAHYMVTAVDLNQNASTPAFVSHRRSLNGEPPAPTGFAGRSNGSSGGLGKVLLTWDVVVPIQHLGYVGDTLAGYDVERLDGSSWTRLRSAGDLQGNTTSYENVGLALQSDFTYRVRAVDGDGDFSQWVTATAATGDGVNPDQPDLVSKDDNGFNSVTLTWEAGSGSGDATVAYRVFRSLSPTSGFSLHPAYATDQASTTLVDTSLSGSTTYYYNVYAVDADGDLSEPLSITQSTQVLTIAKRPFVEITSPGIGASPLEVSVDTKIRGIVDDENNNLGSWTLVLRPLTPVGQLNDIVVASGNAEVGQIPSQDALLGTIQPTLLQNGVYKLVVKTVETGVSDPETEYEAGLVRIKSDVKVGNFTLPITDLEVEGADGTTVTVTRVYDSSRASQQGEFGFGWRLEVGDTQLRTTETDSGRAGSETTIRYGDIVYVTIPGQGEHAFEFVPRPSTYEQGAGWPLYAFDPVHIFYAGDTYTPHFVSVDGSGATLQLDGYEDGLKYDREHKTFFGDLNGQSFNPASSAFGGKYLLTTATGEKYSVNASTGKLSSSEDANGNVTTYGANSVTGGGKTLTYHRDSFGRIDWISTEPTGTGGQTVRYEYSPYVYDADNRIVSGGDLVAVIDPTGRRTEMRYTDGVAEAPAAFEQPHLLTKLIDPRGLEAVKVTYDESGKVVLVEDVREDKSTVGYGGFNGKTGSTTNTDLAGNTTEQVFNERGDIVRSIQTVKNGNVIVKYVVTVHDYAYNSTNTVGSLRDKVLDGKTHYNRLFSQTDWQSFEISGSDAQGVRYTSRPEDQGVTFVQQVTYHILEDLNDPDNGHLASETTLLPDGETHRTIQYSEYVLGRPGRIVDTLTGAETINTYDVAGNLTGTQNPLGEKTFYSYTNGASYAYKDGSGSVDYSALPKGLLLETWVERHDGPDAGNDPDLIVQSSNRYYSSTATARNFGRLASSTDAAGHTTYNAYDEVGRAYLTWYVATDPTHGSVRVESETTYDAAGREVRSVTARLVKVVDDQVVDAGTSTQTFYDVNGTTLASKDQFGHLTVLTYDARGNLVRTLHPDGTETRSVYDDIGRLVWATDRFESSSAYSFNESTGVLTWSAQDTTSTYVATRNVYDVLGRLVGMERYKNVKVGIAPDIATGLYTTNAPAAGMLVPANLVSTTMTVYDERGRAVESVNALGLRTGSIYYENGQLNFSGPLKTSGVPDNWYASSDPLQYFMEDATTGNPLVTTYTYDLVGTTNDPLPDSAVSYDLVMDANGSATRTYKDVLGRIIMTVWDSGTTSTADDVETRVFYGIDSEPADGGTVVTIDLPSAGEGWIGVPAGGRHVVKIDAMGRQTHELYDKAGRLSDVWLPAVDDATVAGDNPERPHWHYTYDARGNQLTQVDPRDKVTSFAYDAENRRLSRTLPADSDGNTTNDTEAWTYDGYGRVKTHADFKGQTTAYEYDDSSTGGGRLWNEYRFNTGVAALDGAGAIRTANAAERMNYIYDGLGRQAGVNEYVGATLARETVYEYDPVTGGLILIDSPEGVIEHEYEPATGRLTRTWTADNDTSYGYDDLGRLETVTQTKVNGTTLTTPRVTTYAYDAVGRLDLTTEDNGTATVADDLVHDYMYNGLNRLTVLDVRQGDGDKLFEQSFSYFDDGQKSDVTEKRYQNAGGGAFSTTTIAWEYDDAGRLATETYDAPGGTTLDYVAEYFFDLNGNRVLKTVDEGGDGTIDKRTRSVFNDRDQATLSGADANNDGVVDAATAVTTLYDANGSTVSEATAGGGTKKYVWDLRNRLVGLDANGDGDTNDVNDARFAYDHAGMRVGKTVEKGPNPDEVTEYLQDASNPTGYSQVLEERFNGTLTRSYVLGNDVVAQADGSTVSRFLYDGGGSTRAIVDATGQVASNQVFAYDAFGNRIEDPASPVTPVTNLLYRGEYFDTLLGQYVLRARNYVPQSGLMLSQDPTIFGSGDVLNANLYRYAGGNPVTHVDPNGTTSILEFLQTGFNQALQFVNYAHRALQVRDRVVTLINLIEFMYDLANGGLPKLVREAYAHVQREFANLAAGQVPGKLRRMTITDITESLQHVIAELPAIARVVATTSVHRQALRAAVSDRKDHRLLFFLPTPLAGHYTQELARVRLPIPEVAGFKSEGSVALRGGRLFGLGVRQKDAKVGHQFLRIDWHDIDNTDTTFVHDPRYIGRFQTSSGMDFHWQVPANGSEARVEWPD